jgi:hypothetical protein
LDIGADLRTNAKPYLDVGADVYANADPYLDVGTDLNANTGPGYADRDTDFGLADRNQYLFRHTKRDGRADANARSYPNIHVDTRWNDRADRNTDSRVDRRSYADARVNSARPSVCNAYAFCDTHADVRSADPDARPADTNACSTDTNARPTDPDARSADTNARPANGDLCATPHGHIYRGSTVDPYGRQRIVAGILTTFVV